MQLQVKVGTNTDRKVIIAESTTATPKSLFTEADVNYGSATCQLDGGALSPADMNKTLEQLGITSNCMLFAVIKTVNA